MNLGGRYARGIREELEGDGMDLINMHYICIHENLKNKNKNKRPKMVG